MKMKFYRCKLCGQIIAKVKDTGVDIICCGEPMEKIQAFTNEEGLNEKHIPVYKVKDGKLVVQVGSIPHPTTDEHFIEWIALVTNKGNQRKVLKPGQPASACFCLDKDEVVEEIYAYCNIHSLWRLDVKANDFQKEMKAHCSENN